MDGWREGRTEEEEMTKRKKGNTGGRSKGGLDNKVCNKKSKKFIKGQQREKLDGKNKKKGVKYDFEKDW